METPDNFQQGDEHKADITIATVHYLEQEFIQPIRRTLMSIASAIAERENPSTPVYMVTQEHINQAVEQLLFADGKELQNMFDEKWASEELYRQENEVQRQKEQDPLYDGMRVSPMFLLDDEERGKVDSR